VTVVGLGRTGLALVQYLARAHARLTVSDQKKEAELGTSIARLAPYSVKYSLGGHDEGVICSSEVIFLSPGVPSDLPVIQKAREKGIPITTELELFLELCPAPVIGVTGTKGKTTTTTLIGEMLKRGPRPVLVGGNIGTPVINKLTQLTPRYWVILEMSSFQLESLTVSPHIAVVLNLGEDHLDRYPNMESYVAAKKPILAYQRKKDIAILNADDSLVWDLKNLSAGQIFPFSRVQKLERGVSLRDGKISIADEGGQTPVIEARKILLPGSHNLENVLAAVAVGHKAGIKAEVMAQVVSSFKGVEHRQEFVVVKKGVTYINNSQGTNPMATIRAIESYDQPVILIVGGKDKGTDFTALARAILEKTRGAILMGQSALKIEEALTRVRQSEPGLKASSAVIERRSTLAEAVTLSSELARAGDLVLLSPACSSFDQFSDYEERGRVFKELVSKLED